MINPSLMLDRIKAEKKNIIITLILLALLATYFFVYYVPLANRINSLKQEINRKRILSAWVEQQQSELQILKANTVIPSKLSAPLLEVITTDSQMLTDYISDIKPLEKNQVSLQVNNISFDKLISWLEQIYQTHGIEVSNLTLDRTEANLIAGKITVKAKS